MERPLPIRSPRLRDLQALAGALLDTASEPGRHRELLTACFAKPATPAVLDQLGALLNLQLQRRPLLRLRSLAASLQGESAFRQLCAEFGFLPTPLLRRPQMHTIPGLPALPELETLSDLARWLRLDSALQAWLADLHDRNAHASRTALQHYIVHLRPKPRGGVRVVEAPKPLLRSVQRQILSGLLDRVPLHAAVHGFRKQHSTLTHAAAHAGKPVVLRMDLKDFFPSISGPRVQALFRTLGYPEAVADVLGGLCTVTTPKGLWKHVPGLRAEDCQELQAFYARPHLPQGAPTSPAVANLCAFRLDRRLHGLACSAEAQYTRYADDLAFSGATKLARSFQSFTARVAAIAAEEGFHVQHRKTRLMRTGVPQRLTGLVVNTRSNLPRATLKQLEATLFNCVQQGPASQNREQHPNFRQHLEGRVAYATQVNATRARKLQKLLQKIVWEAGPSSSTPPQP